jgi:NAD(P)-dependent dehydrogenase (short-subunit alcohol dehydrogenase family)
MKIEVRDLKVLVTAGGAGIGRAVAESFHAAGARVHICDIDGAALADVMAANPGMGGGVCDVAASSAVESLFAEALENLGGLDVLVNNAGVGGPRVELDALSYEDWEAVIAVNLNGMFYCIKHAAAVMKPQGNGCIVNISTSSARTGLPLRSPYVASKCGVDGLTRNVARELGPYNIRCNAILPGIISNARGRNLVDRLARERGQTFEATEAEYLRYVSMRTWIDPQEIANVALFLASPLAPHVSGQLIGVCGNAEWEE